MASTTSPDLLKTLSAKVYRLIISRIDGLQLGDPSYRAKQYSLISRNIGGFIIFGGTFSEVSGFIAEARSKSALPLIFSSDIERGVGQQIEGMTTFPCQMAMAAALDLNSAEDMETLSGAIKAIAAEARLTGLDLVFTPVMDINQDPDNPIICTRAFSDTPETVSAFGCAYIKMLESSGIASCPKHFPGHGDTSTDSHIALPVINRHIDELKQMDLVPFFAAVRAGASSMMIGHICIPELDTRPATLSERITTGLLRNSAAFNGLIVTDALNMNALSDYGETGPECLKAGADILLHPADADSMAASITSAVSSGKLEPGLVDRAVARADRMRKKFEDRKITACNPAENALLARELFQRSVTLVKNSDGMLPLSGKINIRLSLFGDTKYFSDCLLSAEFADNTDSKEYIFIAAIFTSVAAWRGSSGISPEERAVLSEEIKKAPRSIVISLGSPYVLRYFGTADMLIAAYDPALQAQQAVINCLLGHNPFSGRLPVKFAYVKGDE